MDGNRFWDSPFWDRVKKLSALAGIIAAFVAIAWFAYTIWRDRSVGQPQPTSSQPGGSIVNLWTPTYAIGGVLILTAIIHLLAAYMSRRALKAQIAHERTSNTWLQSIAIREANAIQRVVRVLDCTLKYKDRESKAPHVNFNFHLVNMSVYSVRVENAIGGWVDFAGHRLGGHVKRTDQYGDFEHGQDSYVVITQWLSKEDVEMIDSSNQQCAFTFKNLEVWISGSEKFEHDRSVVRGRLEITCHIERLGQGVLDDSAREAKWLVDIARDQAQTMYRFVHLTMVQCGNHELLREHPYIEFVLAVDNRSLYDITFDDLNGVISFAGRELTYHPAWQTRPTIAQGNTGSVVIRERLTSGDVTTILNGVPSHKFDFSRLEIFVSGNRIPHSTRLHVHHLALTNENLIPAYPKLDIEIDDAVYDWAIDERKGAHNKVREPLYITLSLKVTNHRPVSITLETIKLTFNFNGKRYTSVAESAVYSRRYTTESVVQVGDGESTQNLKQTPSVSLVEGQSVKGTLQFIFEEMDYIETFGDSIKEPISLKGNQVTLLLIDNSEKHPQHATLRPMYE